MTPREFLSEGQKKMEMAKLHFSSASQHMEILVLRALDWSKKDLFLNLDQALIPEHKNRLENVLERRLKGEPLQYILGWEAFYDSIFKVGPGCLIPRKETEHLVEEILNSYPKSPIKVAELGAGSGNIGISVLLERPLWEWQAFESNPQSIIWARQNQKELLKPEIKYQIIEGNFFEKVERDRNYDLLVSNPPYLTSQEMIQLPQELRWEPTLALDGGKEGEKVIEKLITLAPSVLKPGGTFLCEIGANQEELVRGLMQESKFSTFEILKDFSGLPRILKGRLGGNSNK